MRIGFYGDSFCSDKFTINSIADKFSTEYKTYIALLENYYNADITHLGYGGSSHWDLIINQFLKDEASLPDICIFCWTDTNRLYHKTVRGIREREALEYSSTKFKVVPTYSFGLHTDTWKAAEQYYKYLYDSEKTKLEYKASLHYFDNVLLAKHPDKKFIHLWSFGEPVTVYDNYTDTWAADNIQYLHQWNHGVEIRPSLMSIATRKEYNYYNAPNHVPGKENNILIFEKIKDAIEEYK
jgi:hypothetical protein